MLFPNFRKRGQKKKKDSKEIGKPYQAKSTRDLLFFCTFFGVFWILGNRIAGKGQQERNRRKRDGEIWRNFYREIGDFPETGRVLWIKYKLFVKKYEIVLNNEEASLTKQFMNYKIQIEILDK